MSKEIEISGCIEIPDEITVDEVTDVFIAAVSATAAAKEPDLPMK